MAERGVSKSTNSFFRENYMTAYHRFLSQAEQWNAAGRPSNVLPGGYSLIALRCWLHSPGGKAEGVAPLLQEYKTAAEGAQRSNWLDAYFDERETCRSCGESYRFENVSFCTACSRTCCYRCINEYGRAANGNPACGCGNGELVG